jgi:hypothetical protein
MKDAPYFEAINQAALAAFPAVREALAARQDHRASLSPSIRAGPIAISARSKSIDLTAAGRISRRATREVIRFRLSRTSPTFPRARRRGCWRGRSAFAVRGRNDRTPPFAQHLQDDTPF